MSPQQQKQWCNLSQEQRARWFDSPQERERFREATASMDVTLDTDEALRGHERQELAKLIPHLYRL